MSANLKDTIKIQRRDKRRTQSERSDAMRKRLLAATISSLAEEGYSGSTLSSIVRRAGVSRGAQVHHYPHKQALMLDATSHLLRRTYRALGEVLLNIADEGNRLQALTDAAWKQFFTTPLYRAYIELLAESQRDAVLAEALRSMFQRGRGLFEPAVAHYFEPVPGAKVDINGLFLQLISFLGGLAAQAHLLDEKEHIQPQIKLWLKQSALLMQAKKGVRAPPPKPETWDR